MDPERIKRRLNILQGLQPNTRLSLAPKKAERGSHQRVWRWGKYVLKEVFSDLVVPHSVVHREPSAREDIFLAKERLRNHASFLYSRFGDIYPRIKCMVLKDRGAYRLFKVQRNLTMLKRPNARKPLDLVNDWQTLWHLRDDANVQLRKDFSRLYEQWKNLRDSGLSLDVRFSNNATLCYDTLEGKEVLRLKIYDSIPLFVIDEKRYATSGLPQDLVTTPPDPNSTNFVHVEQFWDFLEDWYTRIRPTY